MHRATEGSAEGWIQGAAQSQLPTLRAPVPGHLQPSSRPSLSEGGGQVWSPCLPKEPPHRPQHRPGPHHPGHRRAGHPLGHGWEIHPEAVGHGEAHEPVRRGKGRWSPQTPVQTCGQTVWVWWGGLLQESRAGVPGSPPRPLPHLGEKGVPLRCPSKIPASRLELGPDADPPCVSNVKQESTLRQHSCSWACASGFAWGFIILPFTASEGGFVRRPVSQLDTESERLRDWLEVSGQVWLRLQLSVAMLPAVNADGGMGMFPGVPGAEREPGWGAKRGHLGR